MHLTNYIYFDEQGERQKLQKIMDSDLQEMEKVSKIQIEFNLDLSEAFAICNTYKEKFNKPE